MRATDVVDVLRSGGTAHALGVGRRALLQVDDETSSGNKVLGIGVGAFAIFVLWCACFAFGSATLEPTLTSHDRTVTSYAHPFSVISCLTCWVGTNTKQSGVVALVTTVVFGLVVLIMLTSPRGEPSDEVDFEGYDTTFIPRTVMVVLLSVSALVGIVGVLAQFVVPKRQARALNHRKDVLMR